MYIQKVNFFNQNSKIQQKEQHRNNITTPQMKASGFTPFAYRDFNISFGERLFRTPANFFEQDFNRNNMPITMKRYLFADYEDRQNMPPNQMLKLVFDDINLAENLDEVKYLYPNEPLFEALSDEPKVKARTGVIAEINAMKEDGKSLFKNGKDNLGFYIVKKIYLEGKSLKEINHDFERDISVHYKGLSPIQYETLAAYGIKFPKQAFWKSFLATREDFPYEYKPRKPLEDRVTGYHTQNQENEKVSLKPKKKFDAIQDWQIDKFTNAVIEGNGDAEQTRRSLKRNSAGDPEALNFVAKYMGEINSVVLEKLHVSEEMKDFFENYENLSDSQKVKFKKYWENPDIKELRSLVMSSTIRFFFDVYGADGNNDEFQELLEYAHNIKGERLKRSEEHNRIQAEYDELFRDYNFDAEDVEPVHEESVEDEKTVEGNYQDKLELAAKENNAKVYVFELSNGTKISLVANYEEMLKKKINKDMSFFPQSYRDDYRRFLYKEGSEIPKYLLSLFYRTEGLTEISDIKINNISDDDKKSDFELFKKEYMLPIDEINDLTEKITAKYVEKHQIQHRAIDQTLTDLLFSMQPTTERYEELTESAEKFFAEEYPEKTKEEIRSIALKKVHDSAQRYIGKNIAKLDIGNVHKGLEFLGADSDALKPVIEQKYAMYGKPLTAKEKERICKSIVNYIENYDPKTSIYDDNRSKAVLKAISENIKEFSALKKAILKTLIDLNVMQNKCGDYRAFLQSDSNKEMLEAKSEIFFGQYLNEHPDALLPLLAINKKTMEKYIAPVDLKLYNELIKYRLMQSLRN